MDVKDYIKQFDVLLFDMDKTFMFGGNRYGEVQNYEQTYKSLGGKRYNNTELQEFFNLSYINLLEKSRNPEYYDDFPTVREYLDTDLYFKDFFSDEKDLIAKTFAAHECGDVSGTAKHILTALAKSYKLGLISNVWCDGAYFAVRLKETGVYNLFDIHIFSSEHGAIKPSSKLFKLAIDHFAKKPNELVYIGDNYKRDVIGAKNAGINSILIQNSPAGNITGDIKPEFIINSIEELI